MITDKRVSTAAMIYDNKNCSKAYFLLKLFLSKTDIVYMQDR